MVKLPDGPVYSWRQEPTHPDLKIMSVDTGPDFGEGNNWRAIFSLREGKKWMPALAAEYAGTGGPIDMREVGSSDRFDRAMEILGDLCRRSDLARECSLVGLDESLVAGMVDDYEQEREFIRLIRSGGLVGLRADREVLTWKPHPQVKDVVEYCRRLQLAGQGRDVVEWVHETLGFGDPHGPKLHVLPPYIPEDQLWQPPPDLPCYVCGEKIDRSRRSHYAQVCESILCDTVNQEALRAARDMVRLGLVKPMADLGCLSPRFAGYGSQGPIGMLVSLRIKIDHFDWPDLNPTSSLMWEGSENLARWVFKHLHVSVSRIEDVSCVVKNALCGGDSIKVPTLKDLDEVSAKFPVILARCLEVERQEGAA